MPEPKDNSRVQAIYDSFWAWFTKKHGTGMFMGRPQRSYYDNPESLPQNNKALVAQEWEYWYNTVYPTTVKTTGRIPKVDNENYVVTVEQYEDRVASFLNQMIYKGAYTVEEAQKIAGQIKSSLDSYNKGQVGFEDLPYVNDLSRKDFSDWQTYNAKTIRDDKNRQIQEWEDQQEQQEKERQARIKSALEDAAYKTHIANTRFTPGVKKATSVEDYNNLSKGNVMTTNTNMEEVRNQVEKKGSTYKEPYFIDTSAIEPVINAQNSTEDPFPFVSATPAMDAYKRTYGKRKSWFGGS